MGGGGFSDILIYTQIQTILVVQNVLFQYCLGFQKNEYFGGMKILWIFFGGSSQNSTSFKGYFYAF